MCEILFIFLAEQYQKDFGFIKYFLNKKVQANEVFCTQIVKFLRSLTNAFFFFSSLPTQLFGKVDCLCQCQIQLIENNSSDILYSPTLIK